jgi:hypothetical protein
MPTWEYAELFVGPVPAENESTADRAIWHGPDGVTTLDAPTAVDALNNAGREGWEVVAAVRESRATVRAPGGWLALTGQLYTLKRSTQSKAGSAETSN